MLARPAFSSFPVFRILNIFPWILPLLAKAFWVNKSKGLPEISVALPPASWTIKIPAAMSQAWMPLSQKPSNLPAAT